MKHIRGKYQKHKTESKITVKHYFFKPVKDLIDNSIEDVYPIYVQVSYKGINSRFRSKINPILCNKVDKGEIGLDDLKELIITDTAIIEYLIKEYETSILCQDGKFNINYLVILYRHHEKTS